MKALPGLSGVQGLFWPGMLRARGYPASRRLAIASLLSGARTPNKSVEMEACIFKPDRLGDFVLALGAIRLLLETFGEDRCVLVLSPFASELAALEFPRTPRVVVPAFGGENLQEAVWPWFHTRSILGRYRFKKLICLRHHRYLYHDVVLTWIRAAGSYGTNGGMLNAVPEEAAVFSTRFPGESEYPATARPGFCRELEAHLQTCKAALGGNIDRDDVIPVLRHIGPSEGEGVLVSPFSSSPHKDYPLEKMASAISNVQSWQSVPIRVCVSRLDESRGGRLVELLRRNRMIKSGLLVPGSIEEYVKAVNGAKIVFTVDTATAHIAAALDKPTVVIIGGAHYGFFGPWSRSGKQIWLTNQLDCFQCNGNCIYPEFRCVSDVPPQSISRALELLSLPREVSQTP